MKLPILITIEPASATECGSCHWRALSRCDLFGLLLAPRSAGLIRHTECIVAEHLAAEERAKGKRDGLAERRAAEFERKAGV